MSDAAPEIRFIANLWTLVEHPSAGDEWSLAEKVGAVKEMVARLHETFPNLQLGLERIAQIYEQ